MKLGLNINIYWTKNTIAASSVCPGWQISGGKWSAVASSAQKVANIRKTGEYLRRAADSRQKVITTDCEMKTTQLNDVIIRVHLDCLIGINWPSLNGSFEGMAVGIQSSIIILFRACREFENELLDVPHDG